jgi:transcription elongation factor GreA-like protein
MKKLKNLATAIAILLILASCDKDNQEHQTPLIRDFKTQYDEDISRIENYLKTHSVAVTDHS